MKLHTSHLGLNLFTHAILVFLLLSISFSSQASLPVENDSIVFHGVIVEKTPLDVLNTLLEAPSVHPGIQLTTGGFLLCFLSTLRENSGNSHPTIYNTRTKTYTVISEYSSSLNNFNGQVFVNNGGIYFYGDMIYATSKNNFSSVVYDVSNNHVIMESESPQIGIVLGKPNSQSVYYYTNLTRIDNTTVSISLLNVLTNTSRVFYFTSSIAVSEAYPELVFLDPTHFLLQFSRSPSFYVFDINQNDSASLLSGQFRSLSSSENIFYDPIKNTLEEWEKPTIEGNANYVTRYIYYANKSSPVTQTVQMPAGIFSFIDLWMDTTGGIHAYYITSESVRSNFYYMFSKDGLTFTHTRYPHITPINYQYLKVISREQHVVFNANDFTTEESNEFFGVRTTTRAFVLFGNDTALQGIRPYYVGFQALDYSWVYWSLIVGVPIFLIICGAIIYFMKFKRKPTK